MLKREGTGRDEPVRPPGGSESLCLQYGETKNDQVVMRPVEVLAVFTAPEIAVTEAVCELAPVLIGEGFSFWKRFVFVRQRDE